MQPLIESCSVANLTSERSEKLSQMQVRKRRGRENRHEILSAADKLFEQSGFHQVGVEDVVQAANVTKTTLYRHFGSKDGLVIEVLAERIDNVEQGLITAITAHRTPRARLKAIFDYHTNWFHKPSFAGCLFYRATEEYAVRHKEIARLSREQKLSLRAAIQAFIEDLGVHKGRSESLARSILCLLDGAIVSANTLGERDAAENAWRMAELALNAELGKVVSSRIR